MKDLLKFTKTNLVLENDYASYPVYFTKRPFTTVEWGEILKAIEKAEKYDSLIKANSDVVQNNISLTQLQEENKQLKEKLSKLSLCMECEQVNELTSKEGNDKP